MLLKHQIKRHWTSQEQFFKEPEIAASEKAQVRMNLLLLLYRVPPSVCTNLAQCVTAVANWDYPEQWPDLLSTLLASITGPHASEQEVRTTNCCYTCG